MSAGKRLGLCLVISLVCHAIFFPGFLHAMMTSGRANDAARAPERVKIRLTPPKPKEVAVVKPPPAPPKPAVRPKPAPPKPVVKEAPKPIAKPAPKPKELKPVAQTPPRPAPPKPSLPKPAPPKAAAPKTATPPRQGGGRPPRSTRRLTGNSRPRGETRPAVASAPKGETGGQAGVVPANPGTPDRPIGEGEGDGGGPEAPAAEEPVASVPNPKPPASPPPEPAPEPEPEPEPEPKPKPQPDPPKRQASAPPTVREASIEVPTLKLPASLRREQLKTTLQVRAVIEADGQVDFKLSESSGNPEVDDYVLEQLRKVAVVTTALDDQGNPKRVMKRVRVDIEVD